MQDGVWRALPQVALIVAGAALGVILTLPRPAAAQQSASTTDTSRGLSMLFADGRRVTRPLTASSQMATTGFPTVPGRDTSRDGAPLTGYRVAHVMEGGDAPGVHLPIHLDCQHAGAGRADLWEPHDRVEVNSILWQDGMVEGPMEPAIQQARFDTSRATAVRLLVSRLEGEPSIARLRTEIARSMNFDPDTRQYRDGLLADLDALERTQRSRDGKTLAAWLAVTITECQQWLARIVFPRS